MDGSFPGFRSARTYAFFQIFGILFVDRQWLYSWNSHFLAAGPNFLICSVEMLSRPIAFPSFNAEIPASLWESSTCCYCRRFSKWCGGVNTQTTYASVIFFTSDMPSLKQTNCTILFLAKFVFKFAPKCVFFPYFLSKLVLNLSLNFVVICQW